MQWIQFLFNYADCITNTIRSGNKEDRSTLTVSMVRYINLLNTDLARNGHDIKVLIWLAISDSVMSIVSNEVEKLHWRKEFPKRKTLEVIIIPNKTTLKILTWYWTNTCSFAGSLKSSSILKEHSKKTWWKENYLSCARIIHCI